MADKKDAMAAFEKFANEIGQEAAQKGISEEELLNDLEKIRKDIWNEGKQESSVLKKQYDWIRLTREKLFHYCESLAVEDYCLEISDLAGDQFAPSTSMWRRDRKSVV